MSRGGPVESGGIPTATAIVVAAGRGVRMRGADKIFDPLPGVPNKPVLACSVEVLEDSPVIDAIMLVVSSDRFARCALLVRERGWSKILGVCEGGDQRQDSVATGLMRLPDAEWVVVHDGARPFLTADMITRGLCAAQHTGAAALAVPVTDTIKRVDSDGFSAETLDREGLRSIQTPQVFRRELLAEAHAQAFAHAEYTFTDDATMVERFGGRVRLFEGARDNIKLTTPEDYAVARAILARRPASARRRLTTRTGIGVDVHPLAEGRRLVIGGVEVPYHLGLDGHSDGDVLAHAVMDAMLGAAGLGDIGDHFPSGDPQYRGIDSVKLVARTVGILAARRWRATYVDATIVAQRPKLKPHLGRMSEKLASALGMACEDVNVKATTTDGLGFTGRSEGIASLAVATVEKVV